MPCRGPPRKTTEPASTLTLRFLTPVSDPFITWVQAPPSREMCVSCPTTGATRMRTPSRPANCNERFTRNLSFQNLGVVRSRSINLGQLRQHSTGLRLDVLALVLRGQSHQNSAHAAIGLNRLNQAQCFGAH